MIIFVTINQRNKGNFFFFDIEYCRNNFYFKGQFSLCVPLFGKYFGENYLNEHEMGVTLTFPMVNN